MEASFKRTMPHSTIDRIDRVENGPVHEAFQQAAHTIKRQVGAAFDPARMMQMLFHGTDAVDMIINATDGNAFLPLKAGAPWAVRGWYLVRV